MTPGVKIGNYHCSDWGCILSGKSIGMPTERRQTITIPGMDGVLDITSTAFGKIPMDNRIIKLTLTTLKRMTKYNWAELLSTIADAIYGDKKKIIFDDDPNWYYAAICTIDSFATSLNKMEIVIQCECDPYKHEILSSAEWQDWLWDDLDLNDGIIRDYNGLLVSGVLELTIPGRRMPVTPVFDVSDIGEDGLVVEYNGKTSELSEGKNTVLAIRLTEGDNVLRFIGSGVVTVEYRGGRL